MPEAEPNIKNAVTSMEGEQGAPESMNADMVLTKKWVLKEDRTCPQRLIFNL